MCSWCWGISNHLSHVQKHYREQGVDFEIIVGGLRPGGGDPWNDQMKDFLMHHWQEVNNRSGQPFGYDLFDLEEFEYDTEPSCRAVVTGKKYLPKESVLSFFEEVQREFYVDNQDTKEVDFYQSICESFDIDFESFKADFESDEMMQATKQEFVLNRQWVVRGYPTTILKKEEELFVIANGYADFEIMKSRIDEMLKVDSPQIQA